MAEQKQSQKERIIELTDQLEEGVRAVFESDRYREYLTCMSKFHNYSVYNSLLIFQQRPDASLVAGYKAWQTDHGRYVKKGEKASFQRSIAAGSTHRPKTHGDGGREHQFLRRSYAWNWRFF